MGIILSDPKNGVNDFGLSDKGKEQVKEAVLKNNNLLDNETVIYSSDFLRTKETAEIARKVLKAKEVNLHVNLRERNFGKWEKTGNENYSRVWEDDKIDSSHKNNSVESTEEVLKRTTKLILELEQKFKDKNILLVSHGDALQILQTGFLKTSPSKHREVQHLNTAEIRELKLM
jgi:probable phosphoglycerate mutase